MSAVRKSDVQTFWEDHPVGARFAGAAEGTPEFFDQLTRVRDELEPHISGVVGFESCAGRRVLEVGCGLGSDAERFARAGAIYTGVDLAPRHVRLSRERFRLRGLPGRFLLGDAENLPLPDGSVDFVYSHGVLHHTPDIQKAVDEIRRVLSPATADRPGGEALVMLYHRRSWNYYGAILGLRRLGAVLLLVPGMDRLAARLTGESSAILTGHAELLRREGWRYLRAERFLVHNTDGPGNPLSRVFSRAEASRLFRGFSTVTTTVRYLNLRWLPGARRIPARIQDRLGRLAGWHLYIRARR